MDERMEVADILLRYEKLDMALEVLEELREEFPNEKDVYYKLAKVYEKKGFFDKSLEYISFNIDLKGAISLFPFDVSKVSIPSVRETYLTLFSGNHFSIYSPVSM